MWRDIAAAASSKTSLRSTTTQTLVHIRRGTGIRTLRRHGVLERTLGSEMVTAANTTLDLHLLELLSLLILLRLRLLLTTRLEARHRAENNILAQRRGIRARTRWLARLRPHLVPLSPLRHARVLLLLDHCSSDALRALDLLALLVEEDRHDRLGAVLVLGDLGCRERGRETAVVFVLRPVCPRRVLHCCRCHFRVVQVCL